MYATQRLHAVPSHIPKNFAKAFSKINLANPHPQLMCHHLYPLTDLLNLLLQLDLILCFFYSPLDWMSVVRHHRNNRRRIIREQGPMRRGLVREECLVEALAREKVARKDLVLLIIGLRFLLRRR